MRDIDRSEFGARLFGARQEAKVSQAALAKACGLGQSVIAELERTGQGSAAVTKMARHLGVDPHWLATGQGEKKPLGVAFTRELREKLASLTGRDLAKAENMLRASFEMPPVALPEKRQA